ncbi:MULTISPECIES: hypothetical protein [unclassified Sporosarcina]|uniref:hypothetical protein n=1 Tax=unclassified Sporosarcina TaxID=2647733 RepID=UPI001A916664|nr:MULTISPECIES: hypothetical protein [unclassified Sporosarcina]MBO0588188.1 hypothetical protein [Sporosarcina sp. E16_8]MBO0601942.1 hypothetical protein [Sporosarcina sp. E16_3]
MSFIQLTSACVYCGGVVTESHIESTRETIMSCLHCGYQLSLSGYSSQGLIRKERGGYGTYHIHYKNGTHSYGRFQTPITGREVERFIHFLNFDPSIEAAACSLVRFDKGKLHALVGTVPPLYEKKSDESIRVGGNQYA